MKKYNELLKESSNKLIEAFANSQAALRSAMKARKKLRDMERSAKPITGTKKFNTVLKKTEDKQKSAMSM